MTGESWEISSHAAGQSVVAAGPLAGLTLGELARAPSDTLLGKDGSSGTFPLLFKFIDADKRLSVQVHPDDLQARANGWGENGKTECWFIVDAQENARIVAGLNRNVTRDDISRAIENGSLHDLLNFIPVKKGDVLHIPAGTVHAIMEGTLLYEIQETSDTTLRLYDWGRVDGSSRSRQLHIRDALTALDMSARDGYRIPSVTVSEPGYQYSCRIACRYFALEQYAFLQDAEVILPAKRSFRVLTVVSGSLGLRYPGGTFTMSSGSTALLPAILRDVRATGTRGAELLVTSIPDLQGEIIDPLRKKGVDDRTIVQLGGPSAHNDLLRFLQR
jgi:mannose-6-phosphate isomerase